MSVYKLNTIAPVYISYGNQEESFDTTHYINLSEIYENNGATVLLNDYITITVNDQNICLGGVSGYCPQLRYSKPTFEADMDFLLEYERNQDFKLLMCHIPVCWIRSSLDEWDIDTVFCGHVHGGQIRLPLIGGLWAPDLGWFPGKLSGLYHSNEKSWKLHHKEVLDWAIDKKEKAYFNYYSEKAYSPSYMVLSRGLGNTEGVPRLNNIPEIVVVDFIPEEDQNAKD